ncbi:MAG: XdhC family protein [Ardenticatenales bacterium]|nr:XdhC family protein [Ardenticatenales bacterium]
MHNVTAAVTDWLAAGAEAVAVATITGTWGSAPWPVGSAMAVAPDGAFAGSVSGGCVETAVIEAALAMLGGDGRPRRMVFEVADETAWSVGLACGGRLEVEITRLTPDAWRGAAAALPAPPHIILVGAGEIAVVLAKLARAIDRHVTIVDPRRAFATAARFPDADAIVHEAPAAALAALSPTAATAIVVLSHDPKIDDPALEAALQSPAGYIGALGGRATQASRRDRLRAAGWGEHDIARIHGPVGLAIGARTPAEIALSVLAEIVAVEHGAAGGATARDGVVGG